MQSYSNTIGWRFPQGLSILILKLWNRCFFFVVILKILQNKMCWVKSDKIGGFLRRCHFEIKYLCLCRFTTFLGHVLGFIHFFLYIFKLFYNNFILFCVYLRLVNRRFSYKFLNRIYKYRVIEKSFKHLFFMLWIRNSLI